MDGEITPDELASLIDGTGDLRVVDIRNGEAFERGHIPGSENIPAPELTDRIEELDGAGRVVTVCPHGKASVQAARLVSSYQGVDGPAESLRGGLEAWDGPIEREGEVEHAWSGSEAGAPNGAGEDGAGGRGGDGDGSTAPF